MASKTAKSRPPAASYARTEKKQSRTGLWIAGAVVGIVGLALALTLINRDSDTASAGLEQQRPVEVTGNALPEFPDPTTGVPDPAIGLTAPTIKGQSFDGTAVTIQPGSPTLVVLLAHWCPHCQAEVPVLTKWNTAGKLPKGVNVVGVATSTNDTRPNYPPSKWLSNEKWPWPVIADDASYRAGTALGLTGFPYFVLLDADGKVVWRASGEIATEVLDQQLAVLVNT